MSETVSPAGALTIFIHTVIEANIVDMAVACVIVVATLCCIPGTAQSLTPEAIGSLRARLHVTG